MKHCLSDIAGKGRQAKLGGSVGRSSRTGRGGATAKIRVLMIDDSPLIQEILRYILSSDPRIEVVGAASDALAAREMIKSLNPDVLTLDIEMPKMDGLDFLHHVMRLRPMAVVMVSAHTQHGTEKAISALEMGAVDVVGKPALTSQESLLALRDEILSKVHAAARARIRFEDFAKVRTPGSSAKCDRYAVSRRVVALGASTGGVQALNTILTQIPPDAPPILVAQHMPPNFTRSFAQRLNRVSSISVVEAEDEQPILPGHAYIAPGDRHLTVAASDHGLHCRLLSSDSVNGHIPSIDVLFDSVADVAGNMGLGVLLTGMGKDGAKGLERLRRVGAPTACQDEASCLIFGMPKAAMSIGAAQYELPLEQIANFILEPRSAELCRIGEPGDSSVLEARSS